MTPDELVDAVASAMCRDREEARVAVQIVVEACAKVADGAQTEAFLKAKASMTRALVRGEETDTYQRAVGAELAAYNIAAAIRKLKP